MIERCEPPLHWQRFDPAGELVTCFWASAQSLENSGVDLPAELWEMVSRNPEAYSIVLKDVEGHPIDVRGDELVRLVNAEAITLYPATYRMRRESGSASMGRDRPA